MKATRPTIAQLADFDEIIDVRSPAEFADDHIPGAINCPVLDNAQRAQVGTIYKQVSPFEAKKIGAALVSENIARHLKERFLERPKSWKPLIYCWRGGERSGSMTTIFRAIGWPAGQLDGGYKSWRRHVIEQLDTLPAKFCFIVIAGPTGSAKTHVLQAIGGLGEQILDLETMASHKGSVLGALPDTPQPSQKFFETALLQKLANFDPERPVYVEAESRKVGNLHVPEALMAQIRAGECCFIDASLPARVAFLRGDYDYFTHDTGYLSQRLAALQGLQSKETLKCWQEMLARGDWLALIEALLLEHYDPLYRRSQTTHFAIRPDSPSFGSHDLSPAGIEKLARAIIQVRKAQIA